MALTLAKGLLKIGLAGGAVAFTVQQGVWTTSSEQGSEALDKMRTNVLPAADDYYQKKVPSTQEVNKTVVGTWNSGVQKVFDGVASSPTVVGEYSKKAVDQVKSSLKS